MAYGKVTSVLWFAEMVFIHTLNILTQRKNRFPKDKKLHRTKKYLLVNLPPDFKRLSEIKAALKCIWHFKFFVELKLLLFVSKHFV